MADSSKAEKVSFARVSDWNAIDVLVTDDKLETFCETGRQAWAQGASASIQ